MTKPPDPDSGKGAAATASFVVAMAGVAGLGLFLLGVLLGALGLALARGAVSALLTAGLGWA